MDQPLAVGQFRLRHRARIIVLYQPVNYYECYSLAQDPLFAKVFNALSETPFAKGGELAGVAPEQKDTIENRRQNLTYGSIFAPRCGQIMSPEVVCFIWISVLPAKS